MIIKDALENGYVVGAAIIGDDVYELAGDHAYSVMDTYEIIGSDGEVSARLLQIRNPWGMDYYSGPWNADDDLWTAAAKW